MGATVAALFKDHATAEDVRTALFREGFATDRVQLTSADEPGPVALMPSKGKSEQLKQYFTQVFPASAEGEHVRSFVDGLEHGNAAVVVHPRGDLEVQRALGILSSSDPLEIREHDLDDQAFERAASPASSTVVGKVMPEKLKETFNPRKN